MGHLDLRVLTEPALTRTSSVCTELNCAHRKRPASHPALKRLRPLLVPEASAGSAPRLHKGDGVEKQKPWERSKNMGVGGNSCLENSTEMESLPKNIYIYICVYIYIYIYTYIFLLK